MSRIFRLAKAVLPHRADGTPVEFLDADEPRLKALLHDRIDLNILENHVVEYGWTGDHFDWYDIEAFRDKLVDVFAEIVQMQPEDTPIGFELVRHADGSIVEAPVVYTGALVWTGDDEPSPDFFDVELMGQLQPFIEPVD